jgi:hypothetical protein
LFKSTVQIAALLLILLNLQTFSQDSLTVKKDSVKAPVILLSESRFSYITPDLPDTITRKRFLWYPLKTIDDLFNYMPGYYLKFMDFGQVNQLDYNKLDGHYTTVLRNGRPINDLLDGTADFNLLSRNEISEVEMTNGFGNFLYDYNNGINIINHQIFRYRPYSEISYWQDRYENLYFDGSYDQNIFKTFNFNFGITKNSYDGIYTNSDFDKWQGRFNFNFFPSKSFNSFLYANYSKIQRGLNGGVDPVKNILDKSNLFDVNAVIVRNPDAYEIRERFDVDAGFIYAYGKKKSSFTKLQLFTSNSFRKYRDEENRPTPNGIYLINNSHWIDYGVKLQQVLKYNLTHDIGFISKTEGEYDKDLITSDIIKLRNADRIYFMENVDLLSKYISLNAYAKTYKLKYFENKFFADFGIKPVFKFDIGKTSAVNIYGMANFSNKLPTYLQNSLNDYIFSDTNNIKIDEEKVTNYTAGAKLIFGFGEALVEYNHSSVENKIANSLDPHISVYQLGTYKNDGINTNIKLRLFNFDLDFNLINSLSSLNYYPNSPEIAGNAMLAYHNIFFKNKLEIKIGVVSRFWSDYNTEFYDGYYNDFSSRVVDTTTLGYGIVKIKSNATLDFFVIGKIDKATFGLTFANILNRLYLTSGIYPYQNRGGLFNVWSGFNITWYFLN